jgi:hypothetical protein
MRLINKPKRKNRRERRSRLRTIGFGLSGSTRMTTYGWAGGGEYVQTFAEAADKSRRHASHHLAFPIQILSSSIIHIKSFTRAHPPTPPPEQLPISRSARSILFPALPPPPLAHHRRRECSSKTKHNRIHLHISRPSPSSRVYKGLITDHQETPNTQTTRTSHKVIEVKKRERKKKKKHEK